MGLYYPTQTAVVLIGTKVGTTRTAAALTTAYTGNNKVFHTAGYSELVVDISYTTGSGETNNSIEIKLEDSAEKVSDAVNFYQLTNESASAGTSTITQREFTFVGAAAATTYNLSYRIDISYPTMKLSVKESGVAANAGTIFVEGTLSGK